MRPASNYSLSEDPTKQKLQIEQALRDMAQGINGTIVEFEPSISTTNVVGTVTYVTQEGWYVRQGQMVDFWYDIEWSAWAGAPTGTMLLSLPLKAWNSVRYFWVNTVITSNVTYANAADTVAYMTPRPDSYLADFTSSGNNRPLAGIAPQAAGTIRGHIRYLGQQDL